MKFLGIDYGTKRVGFAVSDDGGRLAFPLSVVKNNSELFRKIGEIIKIERIAEIVVGESLDFLGAPNVVMKEIEYFILKLETKYKLKVYREKEFFTSFEAHNRMGKESLNARKTKIEKTKDLDANAAALILQRFLDRLNNK